MNPRLQRGPAWRRPLFSAIISSIVWIIYRAIFSWPLETGDFLQAAFIGIFVFIGTILINVWMKRQM